MVGCLLARQSPLEALLQMVSEGANRFAVSSAYPIKRGRERWHQDRANEEHVLGDQSFLVSIALVVDPCAVWELCHLANVHGELLECSVGCEGSQEITFPPG